jgi:glycosyltransferase involved in cell wall biosynthesis
MLVEEGPYDVVHSHVGYFSGLVMLAARKAGVRVRIVHSHNTLHGPPARSAARAAYEGAAALLIRRYATAGLAVSEPAAEPLFGDRWRADRRWQVAHLGIDMAPFDPLTDRASLRVELGLPPDAPVVGHVGRFAPQKNHDFLIDIFAGVAAQRPDARLLRPAIERKVASLGLADRVVFAGIRSDVPALLYAMDLLIMPSHHEGLALALLEGQAAGVPMIIASNMAEEGCVVERLIARASVAEPAAQWADRALAALERPACRESRLSALQCMRESAFNIDVAMPRLLAMYEALAKRA